MRATTEMLRIGNYVVEHGTACVSFSYWLAELPLPVPISGTSRFGLAVAV